MRKSIIRSILFVLLFVLGTAFLIMTFNIINSKLSTYVTAFHNEVFIDNMKDGFYMVENIESGDDEKTLTIKSDRFRSVSVLIDNLEFLYQIYINGERVSQNIDKVAEHYTKGYAYKLFEIKKQQYDNGIVMIQVRGSRASGVDIYLADRGQMKNAVETRTICYAVMLMCLIIIALECIIIYFHKRDALYYLLFAASAAVSIVKSINLGELFVLVETFGFTVRHYVLIDKIASNVNMILPIVIMLYLMNIPIGRMWKVFMSICFLSLMLFTVVDSLNVFHQVVIFIIIAINIWLSIYGCVGKKPFCNVIFLNNSLFLSFALYGFGALNRGLRGGALDFYIHLPYLGSIICLLVFLMFFIKSYLLKTKVLREKKKEYERVVLLQGISHDLKLPLSVIKTSNQMIEKYGINEEKRREYAHMSLEAASELEKMTNNISSFLSMSRSTDKAYYASIRECFDKAKRQYKAYAEATGHIFTVEWEGSDAVLTVRPIQLERMLYNLLDNAFKYTGVGGEVQLSCCIGVRNVVIRVSDTGIGMDGEQLDQIFKPFYRGQQSRTQNGLGLGLSVVRGILDNLNGKILTESEKGTGTTFTIILPIS